MSISDHAHRMRRWRTVYVGSYAGLKSIAARAVSDIRHDRMQAGAPQHRGSQYTGGVRKPCRKPMKPTLASLAVLAAAPRVFTRPRRPRPPPATPKGAAAPPPPRRCPPASASSTSPSAPAPHPQATDTVKVHYRGTLADGKEFDSSYKRGQPATFPLDRVVPCWTAGAAEAEGGRQGDADLSALDRLRHPRHPQRDSAGQHTDLRRRTALDRRLMASYRAAVLRRAAVQRARPVAARARDRQPPLGCAEGSCRSGRGAARGRAA